MRRLAVFSVLSFALPAFVQGECIHGTAQEELKRAAVVFVGEVVSQRATEDPIYPVAVTLRVETYWKGRPRSTTIEVLSDLGLTSICEHAVLLPEGKYLVYAYKRGKDVVTTGCTRTIAFDQAAEDIRQLGKGEPPK